MSITRNIKSLADFKLTYHERLAREYELCMISTTQTDIKRVTVDCLFLNAHTFELILSEKRLLRMSWAELMRCFNNYLTTLNVRFYESSSVCRDCVWLYAGELRLARNRKARLQRYVVDVGCVGYVSTLYSLIFLNISLSYLSPNIELYTSSQNDREFGILRRT